MARGVRQLEIDLRLSRDGELVVIHDDTLRRTAGVGGKVSGKSANDMAQLDNRNDGPPWPNKRGTGVPSMTALFRAVPEVRHWQLELKHLGPRRDHALADAVVAWIEKHQPKAVVTSLEPGLIRRVKDALPGQPTGFVSTTKDPWSTLDACECEYLIAHWKTLTSRSFVRRAQARGIHVSAWTVNDASVIRKLYELGIDSVITDYPSMALPLVGALTR